MIPYDIGQTNHEKLMEKSVVKKWLQWNIENIVMIIMKDLQMNQILVSNNPLAVDMPLYKPNMNNQ